MKQFNDSKITVLMLVFVMILFSLTTSTMAELCTVQFQGVVDRISGGDVLDDSVAVGGEFTGSYTFDTTTPPEGTGPGSASYRFSDPQQQFTLTVGNYKWESTDYWTCAVYNNSGGRDAFYENYDYIVMEQTAGYVLPDLTYFALQFSLSTTMNLSAITSTAVPQAMPNPNLFETNYLSIGGGRDNSGVIREIRGRFVSLEPDPSEMVEVPNVVGMHWEDAADTLASATGGFCYNFIEEYSYTVPEGHVISQTPAGGTLVEWDPIGYIVYLTISLGPLEPGDVVVPDVAGMSKTDAESAIISAGLKVSHTYEHSDTVPEGYVISQSPPAGSSVAVDSYVLLTVSQYDDGDNGPSGLTIPFFVDGDFDASSKSTALHANSADQDWYESRQDVPTLVTLDFTNVGGNVTKKAKLTASTDGSAYLTQEFRTPQTQQFAAQWDIYVDSILDRPGSSYDRAAWVFIGDDTGMTPGRTGPNAEDSERFVYLGFYKAGGGTSGSMDLVVRQSSVTATTFITVTTGLSLKQWYTITVICDLVQDTYDVYIDGQFQMNVKARTPKSSVTHISFAEWSQDEGAATFYVDNVTAEADLIPACGPFLVDGDFDASSKSTALHANSADQDWYESRQDFPKLVTLDFTNVGGNATKKAKLTASTFGNAYLTQEFRTPQTQQFAAQWDIYVDSILDRPGSSYDRAAWVFIGDDTGMTPGRTGPNAEDSERFVYLGFNKAGGGTSGTMDLVVRQSSVTATTFITVATGLSLKQWYTITVICDLVQDTYDVYIDGQFRMNVKARTPKNSVTHISFAEWPQDEGTATFYVDNVMAECAK